MTDYRAGEPVDVTVRGAYHSCIRGHGGERVLVHRVLVNGHLVDVDDDHIKSGDDPADDPVLTARRCRNGSMIAVKIDRNAWRNLRTGSVLTDDLVRGWLRHGRLESTFEEAP